MTKQERAEVFRESMRLCRENERLKTAIRNSIRDQKVYWEEDEITVPAAKGDTDPKLLLSEKRTLEAAGPYAKEGKRVCALQSPVKQRASPERTARLSGTNGV